MAKTKAKNDAPRIFKATCEKNGNVVKHAEITEAQAISERQADRDVVICGDDVGANSDLARKIEKAAHGTWKRCGAHASAGPNALNHYQPDPRGSSRGHTFYETKKRKAKKK